MSVEQELKLQHPPPLGKPSLNKKSLDGPPPLERRSSDVTDERVGFLMRFAEKQTEERKTSTLGRRGSGGLHWGERPSQITVHVKGQRGTSLVFDMDPQTPHSPAGDELEGEDEVEGTLGGMKDKWWRKMPSSALNEDKSAMANSDMGPSSFVPQFDLSGDNPYVKGLEYPDD